MDDFLRWQNDIVREYAREDQFVTQNFDFDWTPGWSYGLQPAVDHFSAARTVDLAGTDIYHPTQSRLTGKEIAFGGDMTRSLKGGANYLVLETQAQGQMGWLPYPGQLRLQAYSHIASGALGVMYWHWHSIHNSFETYWKGLLSHDFAPNPTYLESGVVGREWAAHAQSLTGLRKRNRVAVMVSNRALTALQWFTLETGFIDGVFGSSLTYNDVLRWVYDALFDLNVEVDLISPEEEDLGRYSMILTPALYTASEETIERLARFVAEGGHLVSTFRTAVADEDVTVWHDRAPHALTDTFGMTYNQFSRPDGARLALDDAVAAPAAARRGEATTGAGGEDPLAVAFLGCCRSRTRRCSRATIRPGAGRCRHPSRPRRRLRDLHQGDDLARDAASALAHMLREAGLWDWLQEIDAVAVRRGVNSRGRGDLLLNYSGSTVTLPSPSPSARCSAAPGRTPHPASSTGRASRSARTSWSSRAEPARGRGRERARSPLHGDRAVVPDGRASGSSTPLIA